jgi:hypothetical protein
MFLFKIKKHPLLAALFRLGKNGIGFYNPVDVFV